MDRPKPIAYILAGPNGIGKTTANPYVIPNGVPYVNADDIAKQLRERLGNTQTQELANAEAVEQMNRFVFKKQDFAIETNLADNETWLFLLNLPKLGYSVHIYFFSTSDVSICIKRVALRYRQGGHFVRPDIVKFRYENGLKLLRFYKNEPDRLFMIDCSNTLNELCVEMAKGQIDYQIDNLPAWIQGVLDETPSNARQEDLTVEKLREKYRSMQNRNKKE